MSRWFRLLALALALASSGTPRIAAELLASDDCGEEGACDCATCADTCFCCPVRVSLPGPVEAVPVAPPASDEDFAPPGEPAVALGTADIFHPPRA